MAKIQESLSQRKLRRNKAILEQYNELKQRMTCRETYPHLAAMYNISEHTVKSILFNPDYSHSPLSITTDNAAVATNNETVATVQNQTPCQ